MKLNAPKNLTWLISVLLAVLAVVGKIVAIPVLSTFGFWILLIGFVLLALATALKNL